ncbi:MAG: LON peptidase substrate-binding domain-containing protein [Chloroflexota bacterium]
MELPIFPLNTVLFPGGRLPLHIFEDRYKLMVSQCLENGEPFGVCLIASGEEVGGPAVPAGIGTTAYIREVQELEEGRLNIICIGGERFVLRSVISKTPYLTAEVEPIASECADELAASLAVAAQSLFTDFVRLNLAMTNQWARQVEMPAEPGALADYMAGALEIDVRAKQKLLEEPSPTMRLQAEVDILEQAIAQLQPRVKYARTARWLGFGVMN